MGDEGAKQGVVKLIIEKLLAAGVVEEELIKAFREKCFKMAD